MRGVRVSPSGLRLPDLATEESRVGAARVFFRRRRVEMGEAVRAGLVEREREREREGERPRTTSCLRAEKKPCFFSIEEEDQKGKHRRRRRS